MQVETPLNTAKQLIKLSAERYDTPYSFQNFVSNNSCHVYNILISSLSLSLQMEEACVVQLNEGTAAHWPDALKLNIIKHYINTQRDLQDILESKRSFWTSVKGCFQWFYAMLFGS